MNHTPHCGFNLPALVIPPPSTTFGVVLFWIWVGLNVAQMATNGYSIVFIWLATVSTMRHAVFSSDCIPDHGYRTVGVLLVSLGIRPTIICNATAFAFSALLLVQAWRVWRALG
jgi:hypothetical protein